MRPFELKSYIYYYTIFWRALNVIGALLNFEFHESIIKSNTYRYE